MREDPRISKKDPVRSRVFEQVRSHHVWLNLPGTRTYERMIQRSKADQGLSKRRQMEEYDPSLGWGREVAFLASYVQEADNLGISRTILSLDTLSKELIEPRVLFEIELGASSRSRMSTNLKCVRSELAKGGVPVSQGVCVQTGLNTWVLSGSRTGRRYRIRQRHRKDHLEVSELVRRPTSPSIEEVSMTVAALSKHPSLEVKVTQGEDQTSRLWLRVTSPFSMKEIKAIENCGLKVWFSRVPVVGIVRHATDAKTVDILREKCNGQTEGEPEYSFVLDMLRDVERIFYVTELYQGEYLLEILGRNGPVAKRGFTVGGGHVNT